MSSRRLLLRPGWLGGLQETGEGLFWIFADHQPFLFGTALFYGFALRFWLFRHIDLQLKKVPRPGVGPGRLVKSPACKAGLSTNSSTGAHSAQEKAPDVEAGGRSNLKPASTRFGPSSAAHRISSSHLSFRAI
jgi:hypothetical protein